MSVRRVKKEALIGATITFNQSGAESARLSPNSVNNFIDVISLDGLGGDPVIPGAGTYEITFKTDESGGFKTITDNGSLAGGKTGGSALADGIAEGASFTGLPLEIKIIPTSITTAIAYRVLIKQISTQ